MLVSLIHNSFIQRCYFRRSEIEKLLILSAIFSAALLIARMLVTEKLLFAFLPWNLFLAWVPYGITKWIKQKPGWVKDRPRFILVCAVWLIFLPNSFYILTDLFHLRLREESTRWFDLTLIFSFAWNGLLLGILSVREMEKLFIGAIGPKKGFLFLFAVMWLNAMGIYIGRFLRFNSWDVLTNPLQLLNEIGYMCIHPFRHFTIWAMIGCFAVFMIIVYISIKRMAKVILSD